jgi:hypothetical protein
MIDPSNMGSLLIANKVNCNTEHMKLIMGDYEVQMILTTSLNVEALCHDHGVMTNIKDFILKYSKFPSFVPFFFVKLK